MTVYAVQNPMRRNSATGKQEKFYDLSPALKFGPIQYLLPAGHCSPYNTPGVVRELQRQLKGYTDEDFILCVGDPVAIGAACMVAGVVNGNRVRTLVWDKHQRTYNPVLVDLGAAA